MLKIMKESRTAVDVGLKYVNNDACYPSLMVVGQIMDALLSGRYDLNHVAICYDADWRRLPCKSTMSALSAVHWKKPDMA